MFTSLGRFVYDRHGLILAATAVAFAVFAVLAPGVFERVKQGGFASPSSEASRAEAALAAALDEQTGDLVLLYDAGDRTISGADIDILREVDRIEGAAARSPAVASIISGRQRSELSSDDPRDRHTAATLIAFNGSDDEKRAAYRELEPELRSDVFTVMHGGSIPAALELTAAIESDLRRASFISLPATFVLLLVIFAGVVAAALPVVVGVLAIVGAFAVTRLLTEVMDISVFALPTLEMLGLGLAIDYALFMVNRYREEMGRTGDDARESVARTVGTAGRAIVVSGGTTAISLGSLLFFDSMFFRSMAIGMVAAVLVALVSATLVMPALIALMGHHLGRVRRARVLWPPQRAASWAGGELLRLSSAEFHRFPRTRHELDDRGMWFRLAQLGRRWPLPVVAVVLVVLTIAALPFMRINLNVPDERALPQRFESRQVSELFDAEFPDADTTPAQVALTFSEGDAIFHYDEIAAYEERIGAVDGVLSTLSLTEIGLQLVEEFRSGSGDPVVVAFVEDSIGKLAGGPTALVRVNLAHDAQSAEAQQTVRALRAIAPPASAATLVGGRTAHLLDAKQLLRSTIPPAALYIAVVTFVLLVVQFGSVALPLKAMFLNVASIVA